MIGLREKNAGRDIYIFQKNKNERDRYDAPIERD